MSMWLLKTEPDAYSWDNLVRDKKAVWDGVSNPLALKHIRAMKKGDQALIYHTGKQRAAVGVAEVISDPYRDPKAEDEKRVVIDLRPKRRLARPVTLSEIKADPTFADWGFLRIGRLRVVTVPPEMWKRIEQLSQEQS
jgi:predicted RNA-binding protein with PUA-like domain